MKNRAPLIFLVFLLPGTLLPLGGEDQVSLKQDVFVAKDEVQDNIISFGGHVTVEGRINKSLIVSVRPWRSSPPPSSKEMSLHWVER
jgi:hypothetical protein